MGKLVATLAAREGGQCCLNTLPKCYQKLKVWFEAKKMYQNSCTIEMKAVSL